MRQEIYGYWASLPSKIGVAAVSVGSLYATLDAKNANAWLAWIMTPEQAHAWGIVGLIAALVWFVVLLLLRPHPKGTDGGLAQTSHGPQSPNFQGVFHGPVTINPSQKEEKPSTYTPDYKNLDGLIGAFEKAGSPPLPAPEDPAPPRVEPPDLYAELRDEPKGDLKFEKLNVRLYKVMGAPFAGGPKPATFERDVNREILDQVVGHPLSVWARIGEGPRLKISPTKLARAKFDHRRVRFTVPTMDTVDPTVYHDVLFNTEQVMEVWPI